MLYAGEIQGIKMYLFTQITHKYYQTTVKQLKTLYNKSQPPSLPLLLTIVVVREHLPGHEFPVWSHKSGFSFEAFAGFVFGVTKRRLRLRVAHLYIRDDNKMPTIIVHRHLREVQPKTTVGRCSSEAGFKGEAFLNVRIFT